jgi:hypothetical protein
MKPGDKVNYKGRTMTVVEIKNQDIVCQYLENGTVKADLFRLETLEQK